MAVNIVSALGAGSGIDVKQLAEDLVAAERAPRQERIDRKIAASEARISGYAAVSYSLGELKKAFAGLNDLSDFASISPRISQPSALGVAAGSGAPSGSLDIDVEAVAAAQRNASGGFAASNTPLNGGAAFSLTLTDGAGKVSTIAVEAAKATPAGVVSAINDDPSLGITAQLVNVGGATPYKIVVTGRTGAANGFTLASGVPQLDFGAPIQAAADAKFTLNDLPVTRSTNTIADLVEGVTFELYTPTAGAARVDLNRDSSGVRTKIDALVKAYNEFEDTMKVLTDRESDVEEFGGALAGDSLVERLRGEVRRMITSNSSTPGGTITAARDVGLSIDRDGVLQLDAARLDAALQNNFDDVALMFSANTDDQSVYSPMPAGLAGAAVKRLDEMLRSTGDVSRQTSVANTELDSHKADLKQLEERMTRLMERYTRQFAAMESIVGQSSSLRTGLESTYDGLMAMYTKR